MHPTRAASILATLGALLLGAFILLRGYALVEAIGAAQDRAARGELALPVLGNYHLSPDGAQIIFQQGLPTSRPDNSATWYAMPVDGGWITPAEAPKSDLSPFSVADRWAYVDIGSGDLDDNPVGVSPADEVVIRASRSPDGQSLALVTRTTGDRQRLYIASSAGNLTWIGEETAFYDLAWSPDAARLAFVAPRDGTDQVFSVDRGGQQYLQLTRGSERKSSPRWSPNGSAIAYLAVRNPNPPSIGQAVPTPLPLARFPTLTPPAALADTRAPASTDLYLINADGSNPRQLTRTPEAEENPFWIPAGPARGDLLAFALPDKKYPSTVYLYASDGGGNVRRLYPPLSMDAIACPTAIRAGQPGAVRLTISNTALVPLDLPLVLRARGQPFHGGDKIGNDAVHTETVTLNPGETRVVEWPVNAAPGPLTYVSVVSSLGNPYPTSELHCAAPVTFLGLPNLPFLSWTVVLILPAMLLCLPLLLQRRRILLWTLWLAAPMVILLIAKAELTIR